MKLQYQAIDAKGVTQRDVMEAPSERVATDQLRRRGLYVTEIRPDKAWNAGAKRSGKSWIAHRPNLRELSVFTRQMAMLLGAGTSIVPAIAAVETEVRTPAWKRGLARVREEVEGGTSLSAAMSLQPNLFDDIYRSVIAAGEATGKLGDMFSRLAVLARQQLGVRQRVIAALTYPAVLMVVSFAVSCVLLGFVLPRFAILFSTLRADLPAMTVIMLNFSTQLKTHWIELSVGAVVAITALTMFLNSRMGRDQLRELLIRLPVLGPVVRLIVLARVCRMLGLMVESRVPVVDALALATDATGYESYRRLLERAQENVSQGDTIAQALTDDRLVPPAVMQAISAGEQSGKVGAALTFVADCYDEDNQHRIAIVSRVIEPIILIGLGLVVGTVAISLFLPLFDLATAAGG